MFRFGDSVRDDLLAAAVRAGGVQFGEVMARRGTADLWDGPLPLLDGSISDKPGGGVRRTLNATFADPAGDLFDVLAPAGTTLHVTSVVELINGDQLRVPMGVFDVDMLREPLGPRRELPVTALDPYARLQRARFIRPVQSRTGTAVTQQIADLIRGGLGYDTTVLNYSRSRATVPNLVWDDDRAKAVEELATSAGVHVGVDRLGRWEIRDLPTLTSRSDWLVDASPVGVLVSGQREVARRTTANVVVVTGEKADADGPGFHPVIVWDVDPASPTYAGPDPVSRPHLAGPFGVVVYRYSSPLMTTATAAREAAKTILARVTGLGSSLDLEAVRNPALDAFDVIDVLPPRRSPGQPLRTERHIVDSVSHPLTPGGTQSISGRSTRSDEYGG